MNSKNVIKKLFLHKLAMITVVFGILISISVSIHTANNNNARVERAVDDFIYTLTSEIEGRFKLYQYGLSSVRGVFTATEGFEVTHSSFQKYIATRDLSEEFPGALGFGFIRRVPPSDLQTFLKNAKNDQWPNFQIRELSPNDKERYVIQYIEPVEQNKQAVGLDIASEKNRRNAARAAILSGEVRLTGPITLVQATGKPLQSFLILMPMYATVNVPDSQAERDKYGFGWSYAPLITSEVLANLNINPNYYYIELSDTTEPENSELFFVNHNDSAEVILSGSTNITVYGRTWNIKVGVLPAFVSQQNQISAIAIGLLGILLTFLISALVSVYAISRRSRDAVIAEQAKLASIVSSSNDGIIGLALDGQILHWNLGAEKIFGFTKKEVGSQFYLDLLVPKDCKVKLRKLLNEAKEGCSVSSLETLHKHKDGRLIHIAISVSPIFTHKNDVTAVSVILRDISLQKRNEQEIHNLNNNLEAQVKERTAEAIHVRDQLILASEAAELGVWVWDCITNKLSWNDAMFTIYQYPFSLRDDGIEYADWLNRIHPEDQAKAANSLKKALNNEEKWNSNFRLLWADGQIRHIQAQALVKFDDDGTPLSVTGVNRDITSEVEHEQSLQLAKQQADDANASKSIFLSNMSHEIRTPLNGIYGTLQLLKQQQLSGKNKTYIAKAEYSCKTMLSIINDILDFSKIEAGKIQLENINFSLKAVVESISSDMQPIAKEKSIIFEVKNSLTHDQWFGDPVRVGQVIRNIASNAVKFTSKGKIILSLSLATNNSISIEVLDTGIGIEKDFIDKLFFRFSQADKTITRRFGGTGLGLSITQSLVDMMGGTIQVESKINEGTTFKVLLPLKMAFSTERDVTQSPTTKRKLDLTGKYILIAEDNKLNQEIIEAILEPHNASLTIVDNGEQAVKSAMSKRPDLILMDIQMPIKDGVSACQEIHALMDDLPIVALTANVMADDIKTYLKAGFVTHIGKPYDIAKLESTLEQLLF